MELIAIHLARVAAILEIESLDPRGQSTTPENIEYLGTRYSFAKVPQAPGEFDVQKGVGSWPEDSAN